jgi:phosphatidate cytidylyltransferase
MLRDRLVVILILIPIGVGILLAGGIVFTGLVMLFLGMAAWEYARLFSTSDRPVPPALVAAGCAALAGLRGLFGFDHSGIGWTVVILVGLAWFLFRYEAKGEKRSASAMVITLGGILYLGWLGAYFVSLRQLPFGYWWLLMCLAAVGAADSAAYLVGRAWGRHLMAKNLSPKKTWEGYCGGVAGSAVAGLGLGWLLGMTAGTASGIDPAAGLLVGLSIGVLSPLGDLGISMMKREAAQKDSGDFFPGHGGVLDRIDSWLVMAVVGFYTITGLIPLLLP